MQQKPFILTDKKNETAFIASLLFTVSFSSAVNASELVQSIKQLSHEL